MFKLSYLEIPRTIFNDDEKKDERNVCPPFQRDFIECCVIGIQVDKKVGS